MDLALGIELESAGQGIEAQLQTREGIAYGVGYAGCQLAHKGELFGLAHVLGALLQGKAGALVLFPQGAHAGCHAQHAGLACALPLPGHELAVENAGRTCMEPPEAEPKQQRQAAGHAHEPGKASGKPGKPGKPVLLERAGQGQQQEREERAAKGSQQGVLPGSPLAGLGAGRHLAVLGKRCRLGLR